MNIKRTHYIDTHMRSTFMRFFASLIVLSAIVACSPVKPVPQLGEGLPTPWIRMHRGMCLGYCPVYETEIYLDGKVLFRGEYYTKETGLREGTIDTNNIARLKAAIQSSNFHNLPETCCNCYDYTDAPTVVIEINDGFVRKKIEHYHGCRSAPESISTLENQIDEISGIRQWIAPFKKSSTGN